MPDASLLSGIGLAVIQTFDVFICVLLSVAFYTLLERKVMGLIQIRLGPNKTGLTGLLQPFSDAMKLVSKTSSSPVTSGVWGFLVSPFLSFLLSMSIWVLFPSLFGVYSSNTGFLVLLTYLSLTAYPLIFAGWFSNSKYASIGGIRSVALSLSYEIPLSFSIMGLVMMWKSSNMYFWGEGLVSTGYIFSQFSLIALVFGCFLVETGRSPFDLAEGESELVSGYCVEYGSGLYVLVFLSEYLALFFSSLVVSMLTFQSSVVILILVVASAWLRSTLPRVRFDSLMSVSWIVLVPVSLGMFFINSAFQ